MFFPRLLGELWVARSSLISESEQPARTIPISSLLALAKLALENGQDPNVRLELFWEGTIITMCRPLHTAAPQLATELIRHGADPTLGDALQRRPIHWVLQHPAELLVGDRLSCAERYELCNILIDAGGTITIGMLPLRGVEDSLEEFERSGYDTNQLQTKFGAGSTTDPTWDAAVGRDRNHLQGLLNRRKRWYDKLRPHR